MSGRTLIAALFLGAAVCLPASANEFDSALRDLAEGPAEKLTGAAIVLEAVRAQNQQHASLTQEEILELDHTWRNQTAAVGPMIKTILKNELSRYLKQFQQQSNGRYAEIFVTDARGLNVGQSGVTSDYWQGDEDKWQVPFATSTLHFGDVEWDESAQAYLSQLSLPIFDDASVIGVITIGVNVEMLAQLD